MSNKVNDTPKPKDKAAPEVNIQGQACTKQNWDNAEEDIVRRDCYSASNPL